MERATHFNISFEALATLHTPVCDLLGCEYPLVLAGMGGVARSELVSAVCEAGGFGLLGMVREPPDIIWAEVQSVRRRTNRAFGVNLIPSATEAALLEQQIDACIELRVPVVCLFWDLSVKVIERLRAVDILVMCQVGTAEEAHAAEQSGAQVLIAQGNEAGGHVRGKRPLVDLLPEVLSVVKTPVLAAGGLSGGDDIATILSLGAQGAVLGTALLTTHESFAHEYHKQAIVTAKEGQTVLTTAFHINWPPTAQTRVLPNSVTRGEHGEPFSGHRTVVGNDSGRPIYLFGTDSPLRSTTGKLEAMALYAGKGAGRIKEIERASLRLTELAQDAGEALSASTKARTAPARLSSPVCYAEEFETATSDYFTREEILATLNELVEAERAGARIALAMSKHADPELWRNLAERIRRDEVRWCGVLIKAIRSMDGTPSTHTGAFFDMTMAISGWRARIEFVNRGQRWVVRKLQSLIPRLDEGQLRTELSEMLTSHRANIDRVNDHLKK